MIELWDCCLNWRCYDPSGNRWNGVETTASRRRAGALIFRARICFGIASQVQVLVQVLVRVPVQAVAALQTAPLLLEH